MSAIVYDEGEGEVGADIRDVQGEPATEQDIAEYRRNQDNIAEAIEEQTEFLEGEKCMKCGEYDCDGECR